MEGGVVFDEVDFLTYITSKETDDVGNNDLEFGLDDKEFDLPTVQKLPTLESILNEADDTEIEDDQLSLASRRSIEGLVKTDSGETLSSSSVESFGSHKNGKNKLAYPKTIHGSVLKPGILKSVSAQVQSAADRVDAGSPTAIAVSSMIAIGTSHGLVLVFGSKQVLKWCLGSSAVGALYGAISALSFNRDCSRLLCGFANGQITMWDVTVGKLIRTITDAHPPGAAILHIKFTDSLVFAVCCDSGGSVYELEFKRLVGVRTCQSECLFSGSRGEVCAIEPLLMDYTVLDHPMRDVSVLAMASLSKVLVVTLRPRLKVMFTHPLAGDAATLPLLAWQVVVIQVSESDRVIDPVLAFGRDHTVYFYQVVCAGPTEIRASGLQRFHLSYKLLNMAWINTQTFVLVDTTEILHILDVRSETELEVIDLSEAQLVYNTSIFKSLATGGNVSQALAYAGDRACYQSVISNSGQLFVLGQKAVHFYTLRTWRDRIILLVNAGEFHDALSLALSFYDGKAKAVVGLSVSHRKRRQIVSKLIREILFEYVDLSMTKLCPEKGKIEELEDFYQGVVPVCVDYCLHLKDMDTLFGRIYERFASDVIAKGTFLECLEPYIQADCLTLIPPSVMREFVEHYQLRGMLDGVEASIVHLDIASLDIHQVINLCWCHGLYDAIIYVYTQGMADYITPLEQLLWQLGVAVSRGKQLTDTQIRLGNKLLVYIRAYPTGEICADQVANTKAKVFSFIMSQQTKNDCEAEYAYPHLRTLLLFNAQEFLNVLALAFEEAEFNGDIGMSRRQRVVNILLHVMVEGIGFTPAQIGALFTFIARQMAQHGNVITVDRVLLEQVLEFLANPNDCSRLEERQQALMDLIQDGGLQQFDEGRLVRLAENAKFYSVCEFLYEKRCEYDKILHCYLKDPSRQRQVFGFIENIISSPVCTGAVKEAVKSESMKCLEDLVLIDSLEAASLALTVLDGHLSTVIAQLADGKPSTLFQFLSGAVHFREADVDGCYPEKAFAFDVDVVEMYVDLMCQYRPDDVCKFIKGNDCYRLDEALKICQKYKMSEATSYLLEMNGDVQGAFEILLLKLQGHLNEFIDGFQSPEGSHSGFPLSAVQEEINTMVRLCQRNSGNMVMSDRQALWFPFLDAVMAAHRRIVEMGGNSYHGDLRDMTHQILKGMLGYISPPDVMRKIIHDPSCNAAAFSEVKELLVGMLDNYNYEETLMTTCRKLLHHDLYAHLFNLTHVARRSYVPHKLLCGICNSTFISGTMSSDLDSVVVFRCNHSFHKSCINDVKAIHQCDGEEVFICYICNNTNCPSDLLTRSCVYGSFSIPNPPSSGVPVGGATAAQEFMDTKHVISFDKLRAAMKTPSRMSILNELSKADSSQKHIHRKSLFKSENFSLRLAPPCLKEHG